MAVAAQTIMRELGRTFAQAVQNDPGVAELWVTLRHDGVHLWLLVNPIGAEEELRLYGLLRLVDEQFPDADFQLHVLNPASYAIELHDVLPEDAEKIFPHAA